MSHVLLAQIHHKPRALTCAVDPRRIPSRSRVRDSGSRSAGRALGAVESRCYTADDQEVAAVRWKHSTTRSTSRSMCSASMRIRCRAQRSSNQPLHLPGVQLLEEGTNLLRGVEPTTVTSDRHIIGGRRPENVPRICSRVHMTTRSRGSSVAVGSTPQRIAIEGGAADRITARP